MYFYLVYYLLFSLVYCLCIFTVCNGFSPVNVMASLCHVAVELVPLMFLLFTLASIFLMPFFLLLFFTYLRLFFILFSLYFSLFLYFSLGLVSAAPLALLYCLAVLCPFFWRASCAMYPSAFVFNRYFLLVVLFLTFSGHFSYFLHSSWFIFTPVFFFLYNFLFTGWCNICWRQACWHLHIFVSIFLFFTFFFYCFFLFFFISLFIFLCTLFIFYILHFSLSYNFIIRSGTTSYNSSIGLVF